MINVLRKALSIGKINDCEKQKAFEKRWRSESFRPPWWIGGPAPQLIAAKEDGWLCSPGAAVDIGCGSGENAQWLGSEGWHVHALDFSKSAVQKAKRDSPHENVTYEVADLTLPLKLNKKFDLLLDRGCLHTLPAASFQKYLNNVKEISHSGTRFLLLMHYRNMTFQERVDEVHHGFDDDFEVISSTGTEMASPNSERSISGIEFRLLRK